MKITKKQRAVLEMIKANDQGYGVSVNTLVLMAWSTVGMSARSTKRVLTNLANLSMIYGTMDGNACLMSRGERALKYT
jgi:hypothetical protein